MKNFRNVKTYVVTGLVGLAMVFAPVFSMPAQAQTTSELQVQIQALLAQIQALQTQLAQVGGGTGTTGLYCTWRNTHNFSRDLSVGATGSDVQDLQRFLNSIPGIQVATVGAGSPGQESIYYGSLTAAAVTAFQNKYAAQVLAPLGLVRGTGYFGASSRAQARVLCVTPITPPSVEICGDGIDNDGDGLVDENCPPDDDDDDVDGDLRGGEANIRNFRTLNDPSRERLSEGDEDERVLGVRFTVENGDIVIQRAYVNFEAMSESYSDEPWDYIEEVSLYNGNTRVATVDASRERDWNELSSSFSPAGTEAYQIRFNNISIRVNEDQTPNLYVVVTMRSVIDSADEGQSFRVWFPTNGIRALDAAGINQYFPTDGNSSYETFTVEAPDVGDLTIRESDDNPNASILAVQETAISDEYVVLDFELEAEDDAIVLNDLVVRATTSASGGLDNVIRSVTLVIDGKEFTFDRADDNGTSGTYTFEDLEFVIEEDETVDAQVVVEFLRQSGNYDTGTTISFAVYGEDIDAEGEATGDDSNVEGEALGNTHTLLLTGVQARGISESSTLTSVDGGDGDFRTYTLRFEVTAQNNDIYIPRSAASAENASTTAGVFFSVSGDSFAGTINENLSSNADTTGNYFRVRRGQTRTFTLNVVLNPTTSGYYGIELERINFNTTASTPNISLELPNTDEFDVDQAFIPGN